MYGETKTPKDFLIFKETETLKKFYISGNGNFQPKLEKINENPPQENFLYLRKRTPRKKLLYFVIRKFFLYFRKWNFFIFHELTFRA